MKSYFLTKYGKINEPFVNETKHHLPYVPTFNLIDDNKINKRTEQFKRNRREIYVKEINKWMNEPLTDMNGIVYEFPKDNYDFFNDLLEQYKYDYLDLYKYNLDNNYNESEDELIDIEYIKQQQNNNYKINENIIKDDCLKLLENINIYFNTEYTINTEENLNKLLLIKLDYKGSLNKKQKNILEEFNNINILFQLVEKKDMYFIYIRFLFSNLVLNYILKTKNFTYIDDILQNYKYITYYIVNIFKNINNNGIILSESQHAYITNIENKLLSQYNEDKQNIQKNEKKNIEILEHKKRKLYKLCKKHNYEFFILDNNAELYEEYKHTENKIFVSEDELIKLLTNEEINNYKVYNRDVLITIFKQVLELIYKSNYDFKDVELFKEDFIYFMYYLSNIDNKKY